MATRRSRRSTRIGRTLAFLDIRMPGESGLEVAAAIGADCHVVFITAYDQYAIEAFDAGAVDYLLKPVDAERLASPSIACAASSRPRPPTCPR